VQPRSALSYRDLLRSVPDLRRLWPGLAISWLGDGVQFVALVWLASAGPNPGTRVGVLVWAIMLPPVLLGPLAGALADRFHRRTLLIACDLLRGLLTAAIPVLYTLWGFPSVVGAAAISSALEVLFGAAYTGATPEIVGRERLVALSGLQATTFHVMNALGAAAGGLLLARTSIAVPFLANAATFGWSALMIFGIPRERFDLPSRRRDEPYLAALVGGFAYVRGDRPLLRLMTANALATCGFAPAPVALVVLARTALGMDSAGYGMLQSLVTAGLAVGAAAAGRLTPPDRKVTTAATGYIAMAIATLLLGLSTAPGMAAVFVFLRSAANSVLAVPLRPVLQERIPSEWRGRVFTVIQSAAELPRLFILPVAGGLVDALGVRTVYVLMALAIASSGALIFLLRGALEPKLADRL